MNGEKFQQLLPNLVSRIVDDIRHNPSTQHIERFSLPNRNEVVRILTDLRSLLFPGFFRQQLHMANLEFFIGDLCDSLFFRMQKEIAGALRHESCAVCSKADDAELDDHAVEIVTRFFENVPRVRQLLQTDLQAAFDGDPAAKSLVEIVLTYPGYEAIVTHRIAHELLLLGVPLIPRMMNEYIHHRTGIDIHPGAEIGESFFIDHGTGVVIGETTTIGKHVKIYQGVTLGALSFPKDERGQIIRGRKRHPTLEDDVTIYANATILGGDTVIGRGSVVGGNVWLTESVPPFTKVNIESPNLKYVTKPAPVA